MKKQMMEVEVLDTNGGYIETSSATRCSALNRYDLVAVYAKNKEYYIVKEYEREKAAFKGQYVKINREMFYLSAYKYPNETKLELFGKQFEQLDAYLKRITEMLKVQG